MKKIKNSIKKALFIVSGVFPLKLLQYLAKNRLIVINYHSIKGIDPDLKINKNVYRSPEEFESDVKYLTGHFKGVSHDEIIKNVLSGKRMDGNRFYLTFDDGLSVVYNHFYPILQKYRLSGAIFLNPPFVANKDLHFQRKKNLLHQRVDENSIIEKKVAWTDIFQQINVTDTNFYQALEQVDYSKSNVLDELLALFNIDLQRYLKDHHLYLDKEQINAMLQDGFAFGGHSMDHPKYDELSLEDQKQQTIQSIQWVQSEFDLPYRLFAFPLRDHSITKQLFKEIESCCDVTFGVNGISDDEIPFHIHRIDVESTSVRIEWVLKFEYIKFLIKRMLGKEMFKRN